VLDGVEVNDSKRKAAEDTFLSKVTEFNDRVESLCHESEQLLRGVDARRRRTAAEADKLKEELLSSFNKLEGVIQHGRRSIAVEYGRQKQLRAENLELLKQELGGVIKEAAGIGNEMK
jgi:hypothetical protein